METMTQVGSYGDVKTMYCISKSTVCLGVESFIVRVIFTSRVRNASTFILISQVPYFCSRIINRLGLMTALVCLINEMHAASAWHKSKTWRCTSLVFIRLSSRSLAFRLSGLQQR